MSATTTNATTFTVTVDGPHGRHSTTVPVECPTVQKLRGMGHYYLAAYATRYPLAQQVLAEKAAREAKLEADAAEREAKKAAKGGTNKASRGNEPGAVDTAGNKPGQGTTVGKTTLETATVAQLLAELVGRHTTEAALNGLSDAVAVAIDDAVKAVNAPTVPVAPPSKVDAPTATPVPAAPPAPKATVPAAVAAHTVKSAAAKLTPPAPQAKPAPAWTDATLPKSHKAVVALGKDGVASLATWLGVGIEGMPFANAAGAVWGTLKAAEPAKDSKPAPTAKAKGKPAPKATKQEKGKADPSDPILPGVFDAAGRPMTVAAVMAALDAYKAPKATAA